MISNYFKLALRSLAKDKLRSSIEIFGLSIGLGCSLLMLLFVQHEWSFDSFHGKSDTIYRAWAKEDYGESETYFNTVTPLALGPALAESFPEVQRYVRVAEMQDMVRRGDVSLMSEITLVESSFFSMFDFPLVSGSRETALAGAQSVVLSQTAASRFFGESNPLGQVLSVRFAGQFEDLTVSGIAADPPANSSIQFEILIPFERTRSLFPPQMFTSWFNVVAETYVELSPSASRSELDSKFPDFLKGILGDSYARSNYQVGLQPLTDIHLDTAFPAGLAPVSDPAYSLILAAIALLILIVACINYMTLAVARSTRRAIEVGVRKSIGADRIAIIRQFWGEAFFSTFLALGLGLILAEMFRPVFSELTGTRLEPVLGPTILVWTAGLTLAVGLFAGSYPAFVLSRFEPVEILKGNIRINADRSLVRRGLVVAQFTLSAFLITATLLVGRQLTFLESKPLGFDENLLVAIPTSVTPDQNTRMPEVIEEGLEITKRVKQELASDPAIRAMTGASHRFGEIWTSVGYESDSGIQHTAFLNVVDENYIDALGMQMAAGRSFSSENESDSRRAIIVNEAFVEAYGIEDPVGSRLPSQRFSDHEIIGVVKDFHFESLRGEIQPVILSMDPGIILSGVSNVSIDAFPSPKLMVRIASSSVRSTLEEIKAAWMDVNPSDNFTYSFVDQVIGAQYEAERRLATVIRIASILAVIIACLGLFGLAGLAVVRRTKEIGIRKVMGASIPRVFWMLSRDFGILLLVACAVAAPIAYLASVNWLEQFAFHVDITVDLFAASAIVLVAVALLAVSYHGIKAAMTNPSDCLRYE